VGPVRGGLNILTIFFLSGLWHGASWNFIIWGLYHGCLVLAERVWRQIRPRPRAKTGRDWLAPLKAVGTFALVTLGWLFFRETDLAWVGRYLSLAPWGPEQANPLVARYLLCTTLLYSLPLWAHAVYDRLARRARPGGVLAGRLALFRPLAAGLLFLGVLTLASPESGVFIYFKF
jgi:alginate O-acetyltransferase complex protein AlgI